MAALLKPGWIKPSSILFACEIPANQESFAFALAQPSSMERSLSSFTPMTCWWCRRRRSRASFPTMAPPSPKPKSSIWSRWPSAYGMRELNVKRWCVWGCRRPDSHLLREREIDRIVMGTHSLGPIGRLLVGSAAEAVLRNARTPVFIVGPEVGTQAIATFRAHHPLRHKPLQNQCDAGWFCRGVGSRAQRSPGAAACNPAPGARGTARGSDD